MSKSLNDKNFFTREAKEVAKDLLGKYICRKGGQKFQIVATEAYYHDEKDVTGKKICYGADKTQEYSLKKHLVSAALFDQPGTWCIYGGQLLLSVTNEQFSDNVLIKAIKTESGDFLCPDKIAHTLCLYKSKPEYCNCHGQHSLDTESHLYLIDGEEPLKIFSLQRKNISDKKELRFVIVN